MARGKQVKQIPTQFDPAEEVEEIAKKLIPKYHSHIVNSEIAYLFKNKDITQKGKNVAATAEKCSKKVKAISGMDFVMVVSYPVWKTLEDKQKMAVVDHELTHMFVEEDNSGEQKCKIISHDFEDFNEVVKRWGCYRMEIEVAKKTMDEIKEEDTLEVDSDED